MLVWEKWLAGVELDVLSDYENVRMDVRLTKRNTDARLLILRIRELIQEKKTDETKYTTLEKKARTSLESAMNEVARLRDYCQKAASALATQLPDVAFGLLKDALNWKRAL